MATNKSKTFLRTEARSAQPPIVFSRWLQQRIVRKGPTIRLFIKHVTNQDSPIIVLGWRLGSNYTFGRLHIMIVESPDVSRLNEAW
jgi:hypothetical protein